MSSQALSKAHRMSYRIGRGEQGVLTFEPYKSEILPLWRFKTPTIAQKSSEQIYEKFIEYAERDDFVGMDMCRKFLQMVLALQFFILGKLLIGCTGYDARKTVCQPRRWKKVR
jgi:hypothetical protein